MNERGFLWKLRSHYILLVWLADTVLLLVLWYAFMGLILITGGMFQNPDNLANEIVMLTIFPWIAAPLFSGLALLITASLRYQVVGCLVVVGLAFIIPMVAILFVWLGTLIANKLYTGSRETIPNFWKKKPSPTSPPVSPTTL